ncbi:hypothetical protein ACFYVR_06865 [Rhodococcus sp. NPDC003318]|uniref:hypothetical protein n=1 Tax=Rhodococcus sp. NPDC003318 TaxID=3364503 RepID=UPI0036CADE04
MPEPLRYQFVIAGELSARVLAAFPELRASTHQYGGVTNLFGPVSDQTELRSIMARIDSLGLNLVEMRQLPD